MEFLFKDTSFKFETLRAAGFAVDNGADISEILLTAAAIPEGDEEAWMREWKATADRIYERGKYSLEHGDKISAREAFLRASAYYRNAEFYRRKDPVNDPHVLELFGLSREAFVKAGKLLDGPFEEISIPYGNDKLPGYLLHGRRQWQASADYHLHQRIRLDDRGRLLCHWRGRIAARFQRDPI